MAVFPSSFLAWPTTAVDEFHLQRRRETASELIEKPHSAES